jgi:hypothetical protein
MQIAVSYQLKAEKRDVEEWILKALINSQENKHSNT